jgi:serine/threonine-protein kinase PRP4
VFSTVIKCIDISVEDDEESTKADRNNQQQQHKVVAIKLIRNNETMAKAAVKELRILRMLKPTGGNTFCVELLDKFEHLNHTTFVFEYLDLNLRETLHKFGRNVGIAISAVRTYSKQLLQALQHLAKHGVVHADIKPDNILVSANYGMVKLCDFGSAFLESEYMDADPTPYLVSRFYRPPEVRMECNLCY